jgi:putative endonuclease
MPRKHPRKTYQFGLFAEKISLIFLTLKGYKILSHRYKSRFGEIDIIAKKSRKIVFVEVKARRAKSTIEEVLRPKQLNRIKRAAEFFIATNPQFQNYDLRFDFIEIGKYFLPNHQQNFWE